MIFEALLSKKATDMKKDADTFADEHPIAVGLIVCMSAVIFAQHVEINCYRIMTSMMK